LLYLSGDKKRTAFDDAPRCSLPQLKKGGVKTQVLAVFSETQQGSSLAAKKQISLFPEALFHEHGITPMLAIENASCICSEEDDLEVSLKWFSSLPHEFLYISLTWNQENRFGGGAESTAGLKEDGRRLLQFMDGKGIAVDFSHTSDALAFDILEEIDKKGLQIPVMASHSNFRAITDHKRNLPDALAKEIIKRKGIIGLNFVNLFVGESPENLLDHVEHALSLGAENSLCFGADFFYVGDLDKTRPFHFFEEMNDASCYPFVLDLLRTKVEESVIEKICHQNFEDFVKWSFQLQNTS
jgi:microsomal dipeptidase-like Zn-dependent dipeptidase